jgi:uncharacterized membrane protein
MNRLERHPALRGARFMSGPEALRDKLRPLPARVSLAIGIGGALTAMIAMGLLTLVFGDTLLQWQPLPAGITGRLVIVYLSALLLIVTGSALVAKAARPIAANVAGGWFLLWAIALHLPLVWAAHGSVASLNGTAENLAMAAGLATLASNDDRWTKLLRRGFGLCCIVFGTAHYVYADFTAGMIPAWLPHHLVLAYLTGTIHIVTGLCLLIDRAAALAATVEALMMCSFVLLLHLPRVAAAPGNRLELTMLTMAVMLASSAWLVAARATFPTGKETDKT